MVSSRVEATRPRHREFAFAEATLSGRVIELVYRLEGGPDPDVEFKETLELPAQVAAPDPSDPVVARLLDGIHRIFGVSYFKAAAPHRLVARPLGERDAAFWNAAYTEGLGEFYYSNDLDPRGHGGFPRETGTSTGRPLDVPSTGERVIVLVGGGKDSAVAREIVRHAGAPAVALSLGTAPWIERSVEAMGTEHWVVKRRLDTKLTEMNARGAYNGHVPISACIALVSLLVAYLGDCREVVVANERTADEGNLEWRGIDVNHQWSKSFAFEASFDAWRARQFSGGPRYFSLLRPLTELRIAAAFATHPRYFDRFTSCNANFRQQPSAPPARWCGRCPKCVFAYLMIAPYLDDADLERVFGANILDGESVLPIVERLAGVRGFKPFECVGTAGECRAALWHLARDGRLGVGVGAWYERHVASEVLDPKALWDAARASGGPHRIPSNWEARLHAYLGSHGE